MPMKTYGLASGFLAVGVGRAYFQLVRVIGQLLKTLSQKTPSV
jgi:hypothetical protein